MDIERLIRESIEAEERTAEEKAIQAIKIDPKKFYTFANSKRKDRSKIGQLNREHYLQTQLNVLNYYKSST